MTRLHAIAHKAQHHIDNDDSTHPETRTAKQQDKRATDTSAFQSPRGDDMESGSVLSTIQLSTRVLAIAIAFNIPATIYYTTRFTRSQHTATMTISIFGTNHVFTNTNTNTKHKHEQQLQLDPSS